MNTILSKKSKLVNLISAVFIVLFLSAITAYSQNYWNPPRDLDTHPPNPITTHKTGQEKKGGLFLNNSLSGVTDSRGLVVIGDQAQGKGFVGIGTVSPKSILD